MWTDASLLQLKAVTRHAETGWEGFRVTLLGAAHALGAEVAANRLAYHEVVQALCKAIRDAGYIPNADDRNWISQGLHDGSQGVNIKTDDEALGQMVQSIWANSIGMGVVTWDTISINDKKVFSKIGKTLYMAGFEAGADSVNHE